MRGDPIAHYSSRTLVESKRNQSRLDYFLRKQVALRKQTILRHKLFPKTHRIDKKASRVGLRFTLVDRQAHDKIAFLDLTNRLNGWVPLCSGLDVWIRRPPTHVL